MDVAALGTILGVWAHPDDETYLMGGLMAEATARGQRVACATATRGEGGSQDEQRWPSSELARLRAAELSDALAALGVSEHLWLDYPDGGCTAVDAEEAIRKLGGIIEQVEPDSVLTFGPDGMTNHPDHKAVSSWTTEAFWRVGKPGSSLYYATQTPDWAERFAPALERYNVFEGDTPPRTARGDLAIDFRLTEELIERKLKALRAQPSQTEAFWDALGEDFLRESTAQEVFRLGGRR